VQDYTALAGRLGGFYTMEVVVDSAEPWYTPGTVATLDALVRRIEAAPIVSRVVSPLDLLKQARRWQANPAGAEYRLPDSAEEAEALLVGLKGRAQEALAELATAEAYRVRLSALVTDMAEERFLSLVAETEAALAGLPEGLSGWVSGQVLRLVRAQQSLVRAQLQSLGLALILVLACLGLGLRSWRLTLLSVFPNVAPVLGAFALMSLLGWPLDPATVMVASIALGIAVDNTAHLLAQVQAGLEAGSSWVGAAGTAVERVRPAMVTTTLTAGIGFLSLATSQFVPVRAFGLLAAAALGLALAADLLVLPATVTWKGSK
jgi:predicted RND superfamily exporter protein